MSDLEISGDEDSNFTSVSQRAENQVMPNKTLTTRTTVGELGNEFPSEQSIESKKNDLKSASNLKRKVFDEEKTKLKTSIEEEWQRFSSSDVRLAAKETIAAAYSVKKKIRESPNTPMVDFPEYSSLREAFDEAEKLLNPK